LSRLNRATIVVWRTDEQGHFVAARSYGPRTLKQETMQLLASHSAASATEIWTADASMFAREVLDAAGAAWCVRLKGSLHSLFALSSDSAAPARDLVDQLARVSDLLDCVGSSGKSER
jgi:hypothetical protein